MQLKAQDLLLKAQDQQQQQLQEDAKQAKQFSQLQAYADA
jgi:hypothetical protein